MTVTRADVGFRSERGPILIALMLTTGLVAIDSTILATAVPSIVKQLGGFSQFPWLFSTYLLAQAVTVPIYSKLSDMIGRKPVVLIGIGLFLLGSILSATAWSMAALIFFRVIQGLGAGAVQPMAITIAGDIYTVAERAKVQGYLASVWAISAVVGPSLGGIFSQFASWQWIFIVNIPLCFIAGYMIIRNFTEKVNRQRHRIDWAGATLLTAGLTLLILGLLEGGQAWAWGSVQTVAIFGLAAILLTGFVLVERRAAEPVLPLWVFNRRLLVSSSLVGLALGAVLIGLTSFVPTYLEAVLSVTPIVSGLSLAALTIGWPLAAGQAGRIYMRVGFRTTVIAGGFVAVLGAALVASFGPAPSLIAMTIGCFVVGVGLGLLAVPSLVAAQSSVEWNERGVVTGNQLFARSMGSAVGVAIFGAVANGIFTARGATDAAAVEAASTAVFIGVAVAAVLALVAAFTMPRDRASALAGETERGGTATTDPAAA